MPTVFRHNSPVDRGTIFSNVTISASQSAESSVIDNSQNLDTHLDLFVTLTNTTAPTTAPFLRLYITYSLDGVNFEDSSYAITIEYMHIMQGTAKKATRDIPILPYRFKIGAINYSNRNVTLTVRLFTRRMALEAVP